MAILKLENAGDTMTARIKQAETTAGKFGPQVKFEMENGDLLYISEPTAMRQLARIPLEVAECAGETLVFSRDHNPSGKPYWGIRLAGAAEKAPPSKRLSYAEAAKPSGPSIGHVKGLDDFPDEEYGQSVADPFPDLPPTPRAPAAAPNVDERAKVARAALDLFAWVKVQPEMREQSADIVQKMTATIFIEWNKRGLVK